jgi:hypothetical protein
MEAEMPVPQFLYKVKNTFIEADLKDDDSFSDLDLEEFIPRRQITEPTPRTLPFFEAPHLNAEAKDQVKDIEQDSVCLDKIKAIEYFGSSGSELETGRQTSEPFEPEWEPDFQPQQPYVGSTYIQPMVGSAADSYWPNWNEQTPMQGNYNRFAAEQSTVTWQNAAPSMGYEMPPLLYPAVNTMGMHSLPAGSLPPGSLQEHRIQEARSAPVTPLASQKDKMVRRRRRESLIDVAARRQKQQAQQAARPRKKPTKRQQELPGDYADVEDIPTIGSPTRFCSKCGDECKSHFKFCKHCGTPVS